MGEALQSIWFMKVEYDKQKAYHWLSTHGHLEKKPLISKGSHWEYTIRSPTLFAPNSMRKKPVDGITFIYGRYRLGQKGLKSSIKMSGKSHKEPMPSIKSPGDKEANSKKWQDFFRKTVMPLISSTGLDETTNNRLRSDAPIGLGVKKNAMGGFRV